MILELPLAVDYALVPQIIGEHLAICIIVAALWRLPARTATIGRQVLTRSISGTTCTSVRAIRALRSTAIVRTASQCAPSQNN